MFSECSLPLRTFQRMLGLMVATSSVVPLFLLYMQPLQYWLKPMSHLGCLCFKVTHICGPLEGPLSGSDRYSAGAGFQKEGGHDDRCFQLSFQLGSWSSQHINYLEMMVFFLAPETFLSVLKRHHILVHFDIMTVVAYINHQGGIRSWPL